MWRKRATKPKIQCSVGFCAHDDHLLIHLGDIDALQPSPRPQNTQNIYRAREKAIIHVKFSRYAVTTKFNIRILSILNAEDQTRCGIQALRALSAYAELDLSIPQTNFENYGQVRSLEVLVRVT